MSSKYLDEYSLQRDCETKINELKLQRQHYERKQLEGDFSEQTQRALSSINLRIKFNRQRLRGQMDTIKTVSYKHFNTTSNE